MTPITIQNLTKEDVKEVRALGLSTPELQIGNEQPEYYLEETLLSFIQSPHDIYFSAKSGDTLAGYFLGSINPYLKEAYLVDMVVKPEFQGHGIARMFFDEALKKLKAEDCVWAWALVHEDNKKMQEILEKKGFTKGRKFNLFYKVKMD